MAMRGKTNKLLVRQLLTIVETQLYSSADMHRLQYHPLLWELIFLNYFGNFPQDPFPLPKRLAGKDFRHGSFDPRWDELLHSDNGLDAYKLCVQILLRRERKKERTNKVKAA